MNYFKLYHKQDIGAFVKTRRFETKLGERILLAPQGVDVHHILGNTTAKFVLFGIPEDIGVKANYGKPGAGEGWLPFLHSFLNIQSNDHFSGEEILLLGSFDFSVLQNTIESIPGRDEEKISAYRHAVEVIDNEVESLVKIISLYGKIPIAIGGGHNNAYPLIKGTAKGLQQRNGLPIHQVNCINLDAHTDYRPMEGRHSGNGFRYAENDGFLGKYCVVGAHENYLTQSMLKDMENNPFNKLITYEDIFLYEKMNFTQAVSHAIAFTENNPTGIELDMDIIENTPSSAATPNGISTLQARQYIRMCGLDAKLAYLHICEGSNSAEKPNLNGKLMSFLVSDLVKVMSGN